MTLRAVRSACETPTGLGVRLPSAALDPPVAANFRPLTPSTAGTYVIADLPSMTRQWLRVRGVSKKSVGPWSQLANKVVA